MHSGRRPALILALTAALLLAWAHQALTKDSKKTVVVMSTTDVIGYTAPCG
jgi:hypothetical protein